MKNNNKDEYMAKQSIERKLCSILRFKDSFEGGFKTMARRWSPGCRVPGLYKINILI